MSPNPKLNLEEFLPDFNKDLIFKQINGVVDIYRDSWGIPHIKTKDEFDLFFAQGFATAQDRLWHMDFDRYRALGKSSELLGYEMFDNDKLLIIIAADRQAGLAIMNNTDQLLMSVGAPGLQNWQ